MPGAVRWFFRLISIIIAAGLIAAALILGGAAYLNSPPEGASAGDMVLEVKSGETADSIGRKLRNMGVIRSRFLWNLLFRLDNEYIKSGTYRIELPASQAKIRSRLVGGEQLMVRVTIPEGVTIKKASVIFEESGICGAEDFLDAASSREILDAYNIPGPSMEGYLYPDTYLFPLSFPAQKVIALMADTFFERLARITPENYGAEGTGAMSASEINSRIIIASIVEREYRVPEEAALMAGVFLNRLEIGMALQSCATVEYVITEIQGRPHPEILYNRDLEIRDPYNTYIRRGLPPGPISSPGETALKAAFYPSSSDFLYFRLTDPGAGRHYFSRTLDDHIRAGTFYLKGR